MIRWQILNALARGCRSLRNNDIGCALRPQRCILMLNRHKSVLREPCFTEESLKASYTHDQQMIVLRVLNTASVEELRQYSVSKTRATNLVRQRTRKGDFTMLENIFEVEDFGIKFIQNLCDSIVYGPSEETKKQVTSLWQQISRPNVSDELKKTIRSIVSLHISSQAVVWLHLGRDMDLFQWELMELRDSSRNYDLKQNLEVAHKVLSMLPEADAYIVERRQLTMKQANIIPVILGVFQLESMLTALLNKNIATTQEHHVFAIKDSVMARFFNLKIGNEVVSSQAKVKMILSGVHCDNFRRIRYSPDLRSWYDEQTSSIREDLATCLLRAIAFYELEVVKRKMI